MAEEALIDDPSDGLGSGDNSGPLDGSLDLSTAARSSPKKSPTPSAAPSLNQSQLTPNMRAPRGKGKAWEELPVLHIDKVNTLLNSSAFNKWEVCVTVHQPGVQTFSSLSSSVPAKQAKLVMIELRTRLSSRLEEEERPAVATVLMAGMRELAALEEEDLDEALMGAPAVSEDREAVIEVICKTEYKSQVAYRVRGLVSVLQTNALSGALRRLKNLQSSCVSAHDPVQASLAAAVIAGLLTWDRNLD